MPMFKNSSINNHEEFKIELIKAGFEVISHKNKDEFNSFVNPIRQANENHDSITNKLNLICMVTRCKSANQPEPLYSPPSQTTTINNMPVLSLPSNNSGSQKIEQHNKKKGIGWSYKIL